MEFKGLDWRAWVSLIANKIPKRKPNTTLTDEGLQQLEREFDMASAQTIVSNHELANNIRRINGRVSHERHRGSEVVNYHEVVDDYSKIVLRSIEINKEVFQMALGIKEDIKMVLEERINELKKGRNKGWLVATQMAGWAVFFLLYILFKQFFISLLGVALP